MDESLWMKCVDRLRDEFPPQQFTTWLKPLQAKMEGERLCILAPNRFVWRWVQDHFFNRISELLADLNGGDVPSISLEIGTRHISPASISLSASAQHEPAPLSHAAPRPGVEISPQSQSAPESHEHRSQGDEEAPAVMRQNYLNPAFIFENYVEGKSNQLAKAAAVQVGENPGRAYNPLFLYGGVGLGKTHLMHAVGNLILHNNPKARVIYLHSERFVQDMVKALQSNRINEFKRYYRSVDALLIDDIQFFAGKERSQEEFFHTFNALLEGQQQVILTCDRYPKEINGVEERLKSRFGWGLTVAVEPPELETRVAILISKAESMNMPLDHEVAFFIAKRIRSNVRELEGALKRVIAHSQFTGESITIDFVREALKDLLALQDKLVTIENIQKTVAEFFKIRMADLLSKRRTRSIARPRQVAMALAKELTSHSLPEIGDAFGGRDHTTVLHACRQVTEYRSTDREFLEDYTKLLRLLTT